MTSTHIYPGTELGLFAEARNWKQYTAQTLSPYLRGRILEVGAGLGSMTRVLCTGKETSWICLEPDPQMAETLRKAVESGSLPAICQIENGILRNIAALAPFDVILYVDVLEHIADDVREVHEARDLLAPGGRLIVLSPAFQWFFTEFDHAIGHYRRYNKKSMTALTSPGLRLHRCLYLDSVGLLASLANKLFLKSAQPDPRQIHFWDQYMVPLSRVCDRLVLHSWGRSIVGIWGRDECAY
ncbi:MAG: class I SAM-dependent methyltransferase [Magnetococcales bacterium]|nr:class I SAM-dependent methyltransferase [Magnetococcales bacterium]